MKALEVVKQKPINYRFSEPNNDGEKAAQKFLNGATEGKNGRYVIAGNKFIYRNVVDKQVRLPDNELEKQRVLKKLRNAASKGIIVLTTSEEYMKNSWCSRVEFKALSSNIIAMRLESGSIIGNSSVLPLIGRRMSFGRERLNRGETPIQRYLAQYVPMIPFSVFTQTGLDINRLDIIERGPEEEITRKLPRGRDKKGKQKWVDETVHYTGASLFKIDSKTFLFDIDRREVTHKIFNPFLVQLPKAVKSIKEAYDSLIPTEVKRAMLKGLDVKRQGEWFFIPVKGQHTPDPVREEDKQWQRGPYRPMTLRAGNNSPNHATQGVAKLMLVKGKVTHSGREHADMLLKGWHKAIPNTAIGSFTITGDVD
jgi:hypothetical protein